MFKKGDRVKIDPKSRYFNRRGQLPHGVIGRVREGQATPGSWIYVSWDGGNNSYNKEDLIKISQFKGNKWS